MVCDLAALELPREAIVGRSLSIRPVIVLVHPRLERHSLQVPKSGEHVGLFWDPMMVHKTCPLAYSQEEMQSIP